MVDLKPIGQHLECFLGINRFRIDENLTYMFQCLGSCWYSFCGTSALSAPSLLTRFQASKRNTTPFASYGTTFVIKTIFYLFAFLNSSVAPTFSFHITSRYLLFDSPKQGQNISKQPLF